MIVVRILYAETRTCDWENPPDEEGDLASPSTADIGAALSDPNTNLGTLNVQFDYITFDGDIPGAGEAKARRIHWG